MKEEDLDKKIKEAIELVIKLRGEVINSAVNIERRIEEIITTHYILPRKYDDFLFNCMLDEYFSFGLKIRIFRKIKFRIKPYKAFFEHLRRINNIRNLFAHSSIGDLSGSLIYTKDFKIEIKSSRKLHEEFFHLRPKVIKELDNLLLDVKRKV